MECIIELNWLCKHMKNFRSSQQAIPVLHWIKLSFSLLSIAKGTFRKCTNMSTCKQPTLSEWNLNEKTSLTHIAHYCSCQYSSVRSLCTCNILIVFTYFRMLKCFFSSGVVNLQPNMYAAPLQTSTMELFAIIVCNINLEP